MASVGGGAEVKVAEYCDEDDKDVYVRVKQGVWRQLRVDYHDWDGFDEENKRRCDIFDDTRCLHVRKLQLSDINVDIANALTRLANLEELTLEPLSTSYFTPPPGIWPQLRRLTIQRCETGYDPELDIVADENVLSLVTMAPNLRELRIKWTDRLDCLPDILTTLPMLETLHLDYMNETDGDGTRDTIDHAMTLVDCKRLDNVTPSMLVSVRLHWDKCNSDNGPTASMVELAAALVRMQHRAPHRFAIEMCGKRF